MVTPAGRAAVALLALLAWPDVHASAQALTIQTVGDALKVRAPGLRFLNGDPLARLKDGRSVRVELAALVLAAPGKSPAITARRIFSLSYDLWEERFAVTVVDARASVSHLMQAAAEAWCVEQLAIPLGALGALGRDAPFWVRLEYRILDGDSPPGEADSGYTLQGLIDALSRRRKTPSTSSGQGGSSANALEAGPFRLQPRKSSLLRGASPPGPPTPRSRGPHTPLRGALAPSAKAARVPHSLRSFALHVSPPR